MLILMLTYMLIYVISSLMPLKGTPKKLSRCLGSNLEIKNTEYETECEMQ